MAKKADSSCMFCGGLPCVCDGPVKKKSSSKTQKASLPKQTAEQSQNSLLSVKDTEDVYGDVPAAVSKFKSEPALATERDLSYESALRVLKLSGILSEQSEKYADEILDRGKLPQDLDRRQHEWRKRNGRLDESPQIVNTT